MKIHVLYVLLICHLHVCNYMYVHRYSIQSDIMLSYNMNHMIICELLCRILIIMLFVTSNSIWIIYDRLFSMFWNRRICGRPLSYRFIIDRALWKTRYCQSGRQIKNVMNLHDYSGGTRNFPLFFQSERSSSLQKSTGFYLCLYIAIICPLILARALVTDHWNP